MLVNSKLILEKAMKEKFAVPHANFIDLESARSHVSVAEKRGLPLILGFAQSHSEILSLGEAAAIGRYMAEKASVPIVLHLDHGEDFEFIKKAIELGFSSVMIDASQETFEKNVKLTKQVVEYAHPRGITVEAELGHVGSQDLSEARSITDSIYTSPDDVEEFVSRTGCDSLAISIGTSHGTYKGVPKINFERLGEIYKVSTVPLVIHGGSSSGDDNLEKMAENGIAKINIYTDFITAAYDEIVNNEPEGYVEMKTYAIDGMSRVLDHYYDVFHTKAI